MRLIVSDLDGTLLNSKHEISIENINALKLAQENGFDIAIATGRTYKDAIHITNKYNIKAHIISNNGSIIHNKEGKKLKSWSIDKRSLKNIANWLIKNNYFFDICTDEYVFLPVNAKELLENDFKIAQKNDPSLDDTLIDKTFELIFSQYGIKLYDNLDELLNSNLDFCSISAFSFDYNKLEDGRSYFRNLNDFSMVISLKYNFELVNKDASKGTALEYLSRYLNINLDDVIAFGDNHNDISMFKKAGISVAMDNAENQIKKICKFITLSNNHNGVADFIYKYLEKINIESTSA